MRFPLTPKPPEPAPEPESEPDYVVAGGNNVLSDHEQRTADRALNLVELGFSMEQVLRMNVGRLRFDWHAADDLLKRGQTHEQVTFRLED